MAIPFNVPSEEQSESEWVVQLQMIVKKRSIFNLVNEVSQINENSTDNPDRGPDPSPPSDTVIAEMEFVPVPLPSAANATTTVHNARTDLDRTQGRNNLNLQVLVSSSLNPRITTGNGTVVTLATSPQMAEAAARRARRQRTPSESSTCQEDKDNVNVILTDESAEAAVGPAHRDWYQVGACIHRLTDDFQGSSLKEESSVSYSRRLRQRCKEPEDGDEDGLMSKLMPSSTIRSSLWTVVICVIGWRLFRTR